MDVVSVHFSSMRSSTFRFLSKEAPICFDFATMISLALPTILLLTFYFVFCDYEQRSCWTILDLYPSGEIKRSRMAGAVSGYYR